jgi:hypothetical protein
VCGCGRRELLLRERRRRRWIYTCLECECVSEMENRDSVVRLLLLHGSNAKIFRWFRGYEDPPNGGAVG